MVNVDVHLCENRNNRLDDEVEDEAALIGAASETHLENDENDLCDGHVGVEHAALIDDGRQERIVPQHSFDEPLYTEHFDSATLRKVWVFCALERLIFIVRMTEKVLLLLLSVSLFPFIFK